MGYIPGTNDDLRVTARKLDKLARLARKGVMPSIGDAYAVIEKLRQQAEQIADIQAQTTGLRSKADTYTGFGLDDGHSDVWQTVRTLTCDVDNDNFLIQDYSVFSVTGRIPRIDEIKSVGVFSDSEKTELSGLVCDVDDWNVGKTYYHVADLSHVFTPPTSSGGESLLLSYGALGTGFYNGDGVQVDNATGAVEYRYVVANADGTARVTFQLALESFLAHAVLRARILIDGESSSVMTLNESSGLEESAYTGYLIYSRVLMLPARTVSVLIQLSSDKPELFEAMEDNEVVSTLTFGGNK